MTIPLLFALPAHLQVDDVLIESEILTLVLASSQEHASCPGCASISSRVHSHYRRTLADLPCCNLTQLVAERDGYASILRSGEDMELRQLWCRPLVCLERATLIYSSPRNWCM